ncbi:MAG: alanine racemase [Alteromonadaceae bacterium]|jgi:alanine racemase
MSRPARAIINLSNLTLNLKVAQSLSPSSKTVAVVKANGYGHGLKEVALALDNNADALAVACIDEALEIRAAGVKSPIIILEGFYDKNEVEVAAANNFWLVLSCLESIDSILKMKLKDKLTLWLKVETGMHRFGLSYDDLNQAYAKLLASDAINKNIVIMTHFACADELDNQMTAEQIKEFKTLTVSTNVQHSLANSAGLLAWPESRAHWNRPGYMLYGVNPLKHDHINAKNLKAVMTLKSAITHIKSIESGDSVGYGSAWTADRDSTIAIVAIGYGDGYPRNARNGTPVLVNGVRIPLVGRVSMGVITIDITDNKNIAVGDEVILWGDGLSISEVASNAGTVGYELLAGMPARVPRIYQES